MLVVVPVVVLVVVVVVVPVPVVPLVVGAPVVVVVVGGGVVGQRHDWAVGGAVVVVVPVVLVVVGTVEQLFDPRTHALLEAFHTHLQFPEQTGFVVVEVVFEAAEAAVSVGQSINQRPNLSRVIL